MDWVREKNRIAVFGKKYRYVIWVLLLGIFLMSFPEKKIEQTPKIENHTDEVIGLEKSLENILCHLEGAGNVKVLLTEAEGEERIYQSDEDISSEDIEKKTVLITDSSRDEIGLLRQINPAVYRGAVVLCQGADDPVIKLSVVEAVMSVTGLTSDHIAVLKMK